jgi:4-amino-4-deoxy-L-arabinose transferase-like glycosyltransferase
MIPRAVEQVLSPGLKKDWSQAQMDVIHGRYISLGVAILLGLLIFNWSKKLYGEKTALIVLLTYLLCPNFLAHGIFVSSDIFACFFMTLTLYYLWLFFIHYKSKHFILMSIAAGLAEISKFSMAHLFIILPLLAIMHVLTRQNKKMTTDVSIKKVIAYIVVFLFINWLIICASHLFYQVFLPINDYTFRSNSFKSIQHFFVNAAPWFPVPFPSSYLQSMDAVMYFDQLGGGVKGSLNGAPYILGKSNVNGFWYYYFIAFLFKTPISILLFWIASFFLLFHNLTKKAILKNDVYLLLPALYFLIYMNFFYSTQVGIRHILIIVPLIFILSGKIISWLIEGKKKFALYALLVYQGISVCNYFPHFLPYTNELILDKRLAYKKIADTNLCYGEGSTFLKEYLLKNPDAVYLAEKPVAGKVVFEVNEMLNLNIATVHKYDWVKSLEPVSHIHSQYLIFNVSTHTADSLKKIFH